MSEEAEERTDLRGIPEAKFIDDVGEFLKSKSADVAITELNEQLQTLKLLEQQLRAARTRNLLKLPEIKKTLAVVSTLLDNKENGVEEAIVDFSLAEGVFAQAKLTSVDSVNLWLGANVMLEYPLEEAKELLAKNVANCQTNLETNMKDIEWVKDKVTITEVSIARIHNYDVERRRGSAASQS